MWKIKEIKEKARKTLKRNIWTLMILGVFMTSIVGEYLVNKDGYSNIKIIYEYTKQIKVLVQKVQFLLFLESHC